MLYNPVSTEQMDSKQVTAKDKVAKPGEKPNLEVTKHSKTPIAQLKSAAKEVPK